MKRKYEFIVNVNLLVQVYPTGCINTELQFEKWNKAQIKNENQYCNAVFLTSVSVLV